MNHSKSLKLSFCTSLLLLASLGLLGAGCGNDGTVSNPNITEPTISPVPPTDDPTVEPTENPTENPTGGPTGNPTGDPTGNPTDNPTVSPTENPTDTPTEDPTGSPETGTLTLSYGQSLGEGITADIAITDADGKLLAVYTDCTPQASGEGQSIVIVNGDLTSGSKVTVIYKDDQGNIVGVGDDDLNWQDGQATVTDPERQNVDAENNEFKLDSKVVRPGDSAPGALIETQLIFWPDTDDFSDLSYDITGLVNLELDKDFDQAAEEVSECPETYSRFEGQDDKEPEEPAPSIPGRYYGGTKVGKAALSTTVQIGGADVDIGSNIFVTSQPAQLAIFPEHADVCISATGLPYSIEPSTSTATPSAIPTGSIVMPFVPVAYFDDEAKLLPNDTTADFEDPSARPPFDELMVSYPTDNTILVPDLECFKEPGTLKVALKKETFRAYISFIGGSSELGPRVDFVRDVTSETEFSCDIGSVAGNEITFERVDMSFVKATMHDEEFGDLYTIAPVKVFSGLNLGVHLFLADGSLITASTNFTLGQDYAITPKTAYSGVVGGVTCVSTFADIPDVQSENVQVNVESRPASDTAANPDPVIVWNNDTKKITLHTETNTVPYDATTNPPTFWSYSIDFPGTNYPSVSTFPLRLVPGL